MDNATHVAVGLFFQPITALRAEHIGALWGTIRDQFPNSSQNPPLLSPGQTSFSQLTLPGEVSRFWFISADETNLLQLQRDAFFFNWRRRESDYPRFKSVLAQFEEYFSFFVQFARQDLGVTTVTPTAFELTYVNIIGSLESVSSAAEYSKVVPQFHLPKMTSGAKNPNEFNHFDIYQISDNFQLVVTHRSVRRTPSSEFAVLMEIKVTAYDWMEYYDALSSDEERMERIRSGIIASKSLELKRRGMFVKLNVGQARMTLQEEERNISFIHKPIGLNVSHAEMEGLNDQDDVAGALLGGCVIGDFPGISSA